MNISSAKILSENANVILAPSSDISHSLVRAAFRLMGLKRCGKDIEKYKPISHVTFTYSAGENVEWAFNDVLGSNGSLFICQCSSAVEMDKIPAIPEAVKNSWVSTDDTSRPVAHLLTQTFEIPTAIYVNKEAEKILIFVGKTPTSSWYEYLTAFFPVLFNWVYDYQGKGSIGDDGDLFFWKIPLWYEAKDSEEKAKIEADIVSFLDKYCEDIDFASLRWKKKLFGWNTAIKKNEIANLEQQIKNVEQWISTRETEIANKYYELEVCQTKLKGLQYNPSEDSNSVFDFFNAHKNLTILNCSTNYGTPVLDYVIVDTIEYFDIDEFVAAKKQKGSFLYNDGDGEVSEKIRNILCAIFEEGKGAIRVESRFRLTGLSSLTPLSGRSECNNTTTIGAPHLTRSSPCLGGNKTYISSYMSKGDWDLGIEQTISAAKNLNFGDPTVCREFVRAFKRNMDTRFIIADNGTAMTPKEFAEYIKPKEVVAPAPKKRTTKKAATTPTTETTGE